MMYFTSEMLAGLHRKVTLWFPMVDANGALGSLRYSEGKHNTAVRKNLPQQPMGLRVKSLLPHIPESCEVNKSAPKDF